MDVYRKLPGEELEKAEERGLGLISGSYSQLGWTIIRQSVSIRIQGAAVENNTITIHDLFVRRDFAKILAEELNTSEAWLRANKNFKMKTLRNSSVW